MPAKAHASGFTLIELMIVVAIIGILAAIAIPKFANLLRKSREGQLRGTLGSMRSALSIYYGDMDGAWPTDLYSLTIAGKYLSAMPTIQVPNYHSTTSTIRHNFNTNPFGCGGGYMLDTGEWVYWSDNGGSCVSALGPGGQPEHHQGDVWIGCSHTDMKASTWTSY